MVEVAGTLHDARPDGEQSRRAAVGKAIVTVVLVTAVVAAALGGATYVASRALVSMLS